MQIVSLTTDYGNKDYHVAELKANLLSQFREFTFIDISHETDRFDIVQAAYYVENAYPSFPLGSIHIIAVHCNYKRKPEMICFEKNGHYFIGPNNGVFSLLFPEQDENNVYLVTHPTNPKATVGQIFAHVAAYISHGLPLQEIGGQVAKLNQKLVIQPVITSQQIRATIIHIDHFENVIINLKKETFHKVRGDRRFSLYYKQNDPITFISNDYSDVAVGDPVAFFNSAGYLEIALYFDKASSMLNLFKNEMIQINFYD